MTATAPSVSVVIPAYNRAATIRGAIESVLRQTWTDFEIIVVDDGSGDGTPEAVAAIADPRLRLARTPRNMGASAARNLGIGEARGTWVAFQDSDDEWLPLKLEKQMARLTAPGANFVAAYCGMILVEDGDDGDGGRGARPRPTLAYFPKLHLDVVEGDILPTLLRSSIVSTQTLVARRDLLLRIGGFDPAFRALIDRECMLRLAPLGPVACVDEPLVLQRLSGNSITRDAGLRIDSWEQLVEKHIEVFRREPKRLARQYYIIAGGRRSQGDVPAARAALARARALDPLDPRLWLRTAHLAALDLWRRLRR